MNSKRNPINLDSKCLKQQHFSDLFNKRHSNWSKEHLDNKRHLTKIGDEDILMTTAGVSIISLQENFQFLTSNRLKDKGEILKTLKIIRKELTKNKLTSDINPLLANRINIVYVLINLLNDFKNSEIQLEAIWILNILSIYCNEHLIDLDYTLINSYLIAFLQQGKKFSNQGIKNLILEKFFCLMSNFLFQNESILEYYLNNNMMNYLFVNLNSTVRSFRLVCLWLLSKIFTAIASNSIKHQLYLNHFFDKDALFYYRFILSRIEGKKNIDEIYEFYSLINDLAKIHPEILSVLFLNDKDKEISKMFQGIVLDMTLVTKLIQPCIRLISNLVVVGHNDMVRNSLIQSTINNQALMHYFKGVICEINKYDIEIVKDVLILLFNFSCYSPNCIIIIFNSQITTLLYNQIGLVMNTNGNGSNSNSNQNNNYLIKLAMNIYYKMQLYLFQSNIEMNDDMKSISGKIVQCLIMIHNQIINDETMMLITIDLLFIYICICLHTDLSNQPITNALKDINSDITMKKGHITIPKYDEIMKGLITYLN